MSPLPPTRERPITGPHTDGPASRHDFLDGEPPRPGRGRRWAKRIAIIVVVILAMAAGALAAVTFVAKQELDEWVAPKNAAGRAAQKQLSKPIAGKPTNILVIGSDHREGDAADNKRSDTMMLVRLDPDRKTISILSFPRDLYVTIPGHGQAKINDSYTYGGPALTIQTIKEITGQDVNFSLEVDFDGFKGIVDTFDGIFVDVDRHYMVAEGSGHSAIDVQAGYQRLQGKDALAFARHRVSDSDFHRIARQQQVLASLKKQIAASGIRNNIPQLIRILKKNVTAVGGGGDGVPYGVLRDYIQLGLALDGKDVYQIEYEGIVGTAGEASIVEYEPEKMKSAVEAFLSPNAKAREATVDQLVGTKAPSAGADTTGADTAKEADATPAPADVTVTVRNGSGVGGVAGNMAGQLRNAGYQVSGEQTNADTQNYANTRVQYRAEAGKAAAQALAARIEGATAEQSTTSNRFDTQLLVIVGKTGTTLEGGDGGDDDTSSDASTTAPQYAGNAVPEKAAAKVTTDAEYGRELFSQVDQSQLKFPLLYPTARPEGSTYDEVVQYSIVKGKSAYRNFRLVGETGVNGEYWGLQGTNWPDPPILDGATREVVRGGRTYKLYFNGTKLHMVSWRQGAGVYWVTNTILDKLSNETMLAVAASVKPYR